MKMEARRIIVKLETNRYMPLELARQRRLKLLLYSTHLTIFWTIEVPICLQSHLDSVTGRERLSISTAISKQRSHWSTKWRDGVADVLLLHYLQQLTRGPMDDRGSNPILFGSFGISNVRICCRRPGRLLCPFPKDSDFHPAIFES